MTIGKLVGTASAIALLGTLPVSAQTTVDDFKSGSYSVAIRSGEDVKVKPGTMMGSYRYTRIIVGDEAANPRGGAGGLDILEGAIRTTGFSRSAPATRSIRGSNFSTASTRSVKTRRSTRTWPRWAIAFVCTSTAPTGCST